MGKTAKDLPMVIAIDCAERSPVEEKKRGPPREFFFFVSLIEIESLYLFLFCCNMLHTARGTDVDVGLSARSERRDEAPESRGVDSVVVGHEDARPASWRHSKKKMLLSLSIGFCFDFSFAPVLFAVLFSLSLSLSLCLCQLGAPVVTWISKQGSDRQERTRGEKEGKRQRKRLELFLLAFFA